MNSMASGMIMPKPLEPTPFDVEIFVKAPIVIPPEEVISNMLDHDNKSEEDQRVVRTYTSVYNNDMILQLLC